LYDRSRLLRGQDSERGSSGGNLRIFGRPRREDAKRTQTKQYPE
jgi:hypothetical protein